MKYKLLIVSLVISAAAAAQSLPGHTWVSQRYRWIGGVFNEELIAPGINGFPLFKTGVANYIDGHIQIDTANGRYYFYSGGAWRRLIDSAYFAANSVNFATANLTLTGNRAHNFFNLGMDWHSVEEFRIYSEDGGGSQLPRFVIDNDQINLVSENGTGQLLLTDTKTIAGGGDSLLLIADKIYLDSVPQTTDSSAWKPLAWNRTTNEVREFPYFVGGGSSDITYSVFEDSCLVITDGFGSDTVCFTGGSGITQVQLDDSLADLRQVIADTASAIRADFPSASGGNPFADNTDLVKGSADATKLLRFEVDGLTTGTTRTWTVPDVNGTLARSDAAQTFTGVQTFSSNPTFSATSANRVLYTTTGGAITSTANFNFDGSFGRLAGQWSIGATHSGTANRNFEVTGYVNYANATAISGFIPYQQYGGWDGIGTISPSANILAVGGYRGSQWIGLNLYSSGVARLNISATEVDINPTGVAHTTRIRSDNNAAMLFVDGTNDRVGIANPSPTTLLHVGNPGTTLGTIGISGNTSGTITIQPQAAAGTYNFNLPTTAGTSGQVLTSGGGTTNAMTWTTLTTLAHSTYTPTLTNTTNIASSSANVTGYYRVGDMVTVFGTLTVTPTAELTDSELGVSIPVASGFVASHEGGGSGSLVSGTNNNNSVAIDMDATNDRARFRFHAPSDGSGITMTFIFSYKITLE